MLKIYITNLGKYNEGKLVGAWLELPYSDESLKTALNDIGIDGGEYEEFFITDYETDIDGLKLSEYEDLKPLNEFIIKYDKLSYYEQSLLQALLEYEGPKDFLDLIYKLDDYNFMNDIKDCYDLGYYYAVEAQDIFRYSNETLEMYFDFEAYGRDIELNGRGAFIKGGWLELV